MPTITSDKADYLPNSEVVLTGSGWQLGESVHIVVNDDGLQPEGFTHEATVVVDAAGNFVYPFDLPRWEVANFTVTATGDLSGTANAAFTDAPFAANGCVVVLGTITVNTTLDPTPALDALCSLREAIMASNVLNGAVLGTVTKIVVPAGTYTLTIAGRGENNDEEGDLDVRESVEISGAGSGTTIVQAGPNPASNALAIDDPAQPLDRVFNVLTPGTHLNLNNLTVRHGYANQAGGGIRVDNGNLQPPPEGANKLDLTNVVVTLNKLTSGNGGAGIYIDGFNVDTTVQNSNIVNNDTDQSCNGCDGGAIFNKGRSLDIDDSHLDNNHAGGKAGALWNNNGGQVTIDDSTLNSNTNNNSGAADLDGYGGAIYEADEDSLITLTNSNVNGNTSTGRGGGIYIQNGRILIDHSTVNNNTLNGPRDGGGIHNRSNLENPAAVRIIDSTVASNKAGRDGGGYFDDGSTHDILFVNRSTFNDNTADNDHTGDGNGGGFRIQAFGTIANSTIDDNHSGEEGGGVWLVDRDVNLINDTISDNDAPIGSGLRRNNAAGNDGNYELSNTIIAGNACSAATSVPHPITETFHETPVGAANNLDTGNTCGFQGGNASLINANANLGPLADNGGPTFTRALLATPTLSQAVDAGNDTVCDAPPIGGALANDGIDQRHVHRPQGTHCDIGAYERAATIAGTKFNDLDKQGDKDGGEPGLGGWVINAYADPNKDGELTGGEENVAPVATDTTAANGTYKLALGAGDYVVCEVAQAGWTQSMPTGTACDAVSIAANAGYSHVDVTVGLDIVGDDFGNYASTATVSGKKFRDVDNSGGFNVGDEAVEGWVINAYQEITDDDTVDGTEDNSVAATTTTAADGSYTLSLDAGDYVICEELPADWVQSFPNPGDGDCSGVAGFADEGYSAEVTAGQVLTAKDFGNVAGLVKGTKKDDQGNPLGGWTICAYADDDSGGTAGVIDPSEVAPFVACDETAADGTYTIGLQAGDYVICEELELGWTQVTPANTKCKELLDPTAEGGYAVPDLDTNETSVNNDFVNTEEVDTTTIAGTKFDDQDEERDFDVGEPGVEGFLIEAYADDGAGGGTANNGIIDGTEGAAAAFSDTTAADGTYELTVTPGSYVVCEQPKADWAQSYPNPGDADCTPVSDMTEGYKFLNLVAGDHKTGKDFGNYAGIVSGMKFDDVNRDGNKSGDSGVSGFVIKAYADTDENGALDATEAAAAPVATATTASDGTYSLALQAGDYVICEAQQATWAESTPLNNKCKAASGAAAPGGYAIQDLDTTVNYPDRDFGNFHGALVSGLKFDDRDQNGTNAADPNDPPLAGFTIKAYTDGADGGNGVLSPAEAGVAAVATTTTSNPEGEYFLPLAPGQYVICEVLPASGWVQSAPAPADNECDNVSGAGNGGHAVTVVAGDGADGRDFGNYRTAQLQVTKTYSEGNAGPVNVTLNCSSGTWSPTTPTSTPATFTITGFAAGAKCTATENPVPPGYAQDNSDCVDVPIETDNTCNILNVKSVVLLTQGACSFDRDPVRSLRQFPLIYTPEGAASKLSATNPGEFFMNAAYSGPKSQVTIKIPFPFVTASATPVHVYNGVTLHTESGKTCYSPKGPSLGHQDTQVTWNYPGPTPPADGFSSPEKTITVTVPQPSGFVYVRVHLKYGLKGVAGGCSKDTSTPPKATCTTMNGITRKVGATDTPLVIGGSPTIGWQPYKFSFTDVPAGGTITQSETVESFNIFKKDPGIGGLVLQAPSNTPMPNAKVQIYQGSTLKATVYTDEDGWYMWTYKYSGKATTFTVKLIAGFGGVLAGQQQNLTMKSNGYLIQNFTVPPPPP